MKISKEELLEQQKQDRIKKRKKEIADARTKRAEDKRIEKQVKIEMAKTPNQIDFEEQQLRTRVKQKAMISALKSSLGVISPALDKVGIARSQHDRWYAKDGWYKEKVREVEERAYDFVESSIHKQIANDVPSTTIFYAKTKMKHRGYVEGQAVQTEKNNKFSDLSDEELSERLKKSEDPKIRKLKTG